MDVILCFYLANSYRCSVEAYLYIGVNLNANPFKTSFPARGQKYSSLIGHSETRLNTCDICSPLLRIALNVSSMKLFQTRTKVQVSLRFGEGRFCVLKSLRSFLTQIVRRTPHKAVKHTLLLTQRFKLFEAEGSFGKVLERFSKHRQQLRHCSQSDGCRKSHVLHQNSEIQHG